MLENLTGAKHQNLVPNDNVENSEGATMAANVPYSDDTNFSPLF